MGQWMNVELNHDCVFIRNARGIAPTFIPVPPLGVEPKPHALQAYVQTSYTKAACACFRLERNDYFVGIAI